MDDGTYFRKNKHGVLITQANVLVIEAEGVENTCEPVLQSYKLLACPTSFLNRFTGIPTRTHPAWKHCAISSLSSIYHKKHLPNLILAGDFNLSDIDWEKYAGQVLPAVNNWINQIAIYMANELCLRQILGEPTRGRNTFDLLFVSSADLVEKLGSNAWNRWPWRCNRTPHSQD